MALLTDTDLLLHSIRLTYLRDVDDPYGPRIISLDSSYQSNPYILATGLADPERWPQLNRPESPNLSEDEQERPLGFPGARLRHTQTIMGGRTGGLGLRVNAKRQSTSKRLSSTPRQVQTSDNETLNPSEGVSQVKPEKESWIKVEHSESKASPEPTVQVQQATAPEDQAVAKVVQFIPKFKGAADMERRRQLRIAARRGAAANPAQRAPPPQTLSFDTSSEEEEEADAPVASEASDEEEEDFGEPSAVLVDHLDEGDDFDPVFVTSRGVTSDSASDGASVFSAATGSVPTSSGISLPNAQQKSRLRLSPVSEHTGQAHRRQNSSNKQDDTQPSNRHGPSSRARSTSNTSNKSASVPHVDSLFMKKKVQPLKLLKSNLSAAMASSATSSNPFAELYATISGRGEVASTNVQVFFPHCKQPRGKPMDLHIRRDASVEEVIGFALWTYWEEGWQPKLDEGLNGEDDPNRQIKLSTVGWVLKIAEDDGEVDDDFPSPDRLGKISKFNADAYAILEASPNQVQQNQVLESKAQRGPLASAPKRPEKLNLPAQPMPVFTPGSAVYGSNLGTSMLSSSLGPSSSHGPQIFLRIRVADTADAVHISTTIPVSAGMYMQEALELVCRKRKLANPKDYALLLADMSILIPLDRTVASLQGKRELLLIKRSMLPTMGADILKGPGKTTDPNASIFNSIADAPEQHYPPALDYTSAYKKYTIYRKMPMLVARNERTLAIDGVYIHIMPANKAKLVFENGRTSSFHIKSIADVVQSNKTSPIFKLILNRGSGSKRYDFEAESPKHAAEIVQTIRSLKTALERSGTINKSRRSRHIL